MLTIITEENFTSQYRPLAVKGDFILISNAFIGIKSIYNGVVALDYPHDTKFFTNKFVKCESTYLGVSIEIIHGEGCDAAYNCGMNNTNGNEPGMGTGLLFYQCVGQYLINGNAYLNCPDDTGHGKGIVYFDGMENTKYYSVSVRDNNFTSNTLDGDDAVFVYEFYSALVNYNTYVANKLNYLVWLFSGNSMNIECSNIVNNTKRNDLWDSMIYIYECKGMVKDLVCISDIFFQVLFGEGITMTDCMFYDCKFIVPVQTVMVKPMTNTLSLAPFTQCF